MNHTQLIERLKKAEGPDRELDEALFRSLNVPLPDELLGMNIELEWGPDGPTMDLPGFSRVRFDVPAYTASIDAALSLVSRVLPGWSIDMTSASAYTQAELWLTGSDGELAEVPYMERSTAGNLPLAILTVALTALQARCNTE